MSDGAVLLGEEKPYTLDEMKADITEALRGLASALSNVHQRVEQIERLLTLRLNTPLMSIPKKGKNEREEEARDLIEGIKEGVQLEAVIFDLAGRLATAELGLAQLTAAEEPSVDRSTAGASEVAGGLSLVPGGGSEDAGEDPAGSDDEAGASS